MSQPALINPPECSTIDPHFAGARPRQPPRYGYVHALLLLVTLLVAGSFPLAARMMQALQESEQTLGASQLMLLRFTLAAFLFAPYVFSRYGLQIPSLGQLWIYARLALLLVVFFCCMFSSLETTSVLNSGALFTSVPALTAVYAWLINRETCSPRRTLGLLLATLGALWVVFRGDWQLLLSFQLSRGDGVFLFGCLFLGAYQPLVKRWHTGEPIAQTTFGVLVMAALLLLAWLSAQSVLQPLLARDVNNAGAADVWPVWQRLPAVVYWGLGYLALFTTLLSFFLQQLGALTLGAARTSAYNFLTPIFVMVMSLALEPEVFSWLLLPGVGLVLAGLLCIQLRSGALLPSSMRR